MLSLIENRVIAYSEEELISLEIFLSCGDCSVSLDFRPSPSVSLASVSSRAHHDVHNSSDIVISRYGQIGLNWCSAMPRSKWWFGNCLPHTDQVLFAARGGHCCSESDTA